MFRGSKTVLAALALVGCSSLMIASTARADDISNASAAQFWSQAVGAGWTIGQATYHAPAIPAAAVNGPYSLTGQQTREDARQFWSKYTGERITLGNAVLIVPAPR